MRKIASLLLLCPFLLMSCNKKNNDAPLLKDVYKNYFSIGAAVNDTTLKNCKNINQFNYMTCENAMKWQNLHDDVNTFTFEDADRYISYAKDHNLSVRGHTLVWHRAMDESVFNNDKETILEIEKNHIDQVVSHFADSVSCWDVCNEVITDDVTPLKEDESNIYFGSEWYKKTGRDFIFEAYVQADATLKRLGIRDKVKLYYNDYDNTKPVKKSKTIAMLNWLIPALNEQGVKLDGIGMQCHYHLGSFDMDELESAIVDYSALGLDVQITEFDVNIYDLTRSDIENIVYYDNVPDYILNQETLIYKRAFQIFRKHKDKISNVTFWGISDNNCYMSGNPEPQFSGRNNYPFLFDVFEEPKPCFNAIINFKEGE